MREVIFYLAMIIEIAYVFMSQVPKKLENKYLLIGTAFICASDFTYHIGYNAINMSVSALSGTIAISIFLISFVVGVITKRIDFEDLFFSLFMELFLPLLTMLLTKSYELMIFVIIAVVGLGMIKIFMAHKEKNNRQEREKGMINEKKLKKELQKEIETIRERKITVKLSDADCDRLARKCGEHGLTIGELIENFVGDLVGGTYCNGSDERDYADQWFERCWFGMFPEPTLLNHLLNLGYEPEHYLDMLENVETIKSDIEITKQNIAEPSDEWKDIVYHKYNDDRTSYECVPCYNSVDEYIASEKEDLESYKADLEEALEELKDMRADWKPEKEPNMDEEIELIKKWVKEREDFINE